MENSTRRMGGEGAAEEDGGTLEQSPQQEAAEMADARMLLLWGGVGLAAGAAAGAALAGQASVITLLCALCAMTATIALAAVIASVKRRAKGRST